MSDTATIEVETCARFYRAALVGLRWLEARSAARLFGAEADHNWEHLRGLLCESDRIALALRDGALDFGAAFSPREAFGLAELATDEPFGPDWPTLEDAEARAIWTEAEVPSDSGAARDAALAAWDLPAPTRIELPTFGPADSVAALGLDAALALLPRFESDADLDWNRQVVVAATTPAERQIAGLLGTFLGRGQRTRLMAHDQTAPGEAPPARVDVLVASAELPPALAALHDQLRS